MVKTVMVLGAGRVARPCVQYILAKGHRVIAVDLSASRIAKVLQNHPLGTPVVADAAVEAGELIRNYRPEVVVCLLPGPFLSEIAEVCVANGVSMVGATYINPRIKALDAQAREKGLQILCEMGLDPGIDHMSATRMIADLHAAGGQIEGFWSVCGALPALESNTNPLGYKLSWDPESLIGASLRSAYIMEEGEVVLIPDGEVYQRPVLHEVNGLGWFEIYANADSRPYVEAYGIPEIRNLFRGTLRYPGWCDLITQMQKLNLFSTSVEEFAGETYASALCKSIGGDQTVPVDKQVADYLHLAEFSLAVKKLEWLGLFAETELPLVRGSWRDIVANAFDEKLQFTTGEKDLVIMQHRYDVLFPNGKRQRNTSTLISLGEVDGDTAIARTTGLPIGIAVDLLLSGSVQEKGVLTPTSKDIYLPSLQELESLGYGFREEVVTYT